MEKIKVFISYQWKSESSLIALLERTLKQLKNVDLLIDKNFVDYEDPDLRDKIKKKIKKCHCVLVPLTSMMESVEVACELTWAYAHFKDIIILQDSQKEGEDVPRYLSFLSNKLKLRYTSDSNLIDQLETTLESKTIDYYENKIPKGLLSLIDNTRWGFSHSNNRLNFQKDLTRKIIEEANEEIQKVNNNQYDTDVGIEKNFLIRAKAIFENSTKVYAASVDKISTFWEKRSNYVLARDYIKCQPKKTIRVFVFSSAKEANKYVNILHAHHVQYGQENGEYSQQGGVFICSRDSYSKLLSRFLMDPEGGEYLYQDFGILFQDQKVIEAILTKSQLKYNFINLDSYQSSQKVRYIDLLKELDSLLEFDYEKIHKSSSSSSDASLKRWNPDCLTNSEKWIQELKELFPEPYTGESYHCVCFRNIESSDNNSNSDIVNSILEIKYNLERNNDNLGIKNIWFGRKPSDWREVYDSIFRGKINISEDYNYMLLITFNSQEEMKEYYQAEVHGDIRVDLYRKFDEEIKDLCDRYTDIEVQTFERAYAFENLIERKVSEYMVRHDFSNVENIETIVKHDKRIPFEC
jgi:hypothetical protein